MLNQKQFLSTDGRNDAFNCLAKVKKAVSKRFLNRFETAFYRLNIQFTVQ